MKKLLFIIFAFLLFSQTAVLAQKKKHHHEPTEEEALFTCKIMDTDSIPEENADVFISSEDNAIKHKSRSDIDGLCHFLLPEGKKYNIEVHKFKHVFKFSIDLPVVDGGAEFYQPFAIKLIEGFVRAYTLENITFGNGKSHIESHHHKTLNKLYETFVKNPKLIVEIAGHTDNVGDDKFNLRLSQKRADAMKDYLVKKGVNPDRILSKGYGEHDPLETNETDEGRSKNRRTEVKIIQE